MQSSQRKHTSSDAKQNGTQRSTEKSVLTHTHKKKARWRGEKVGPMNKGSFWSSQLVLPIFPLSLTPLLLLSHTPSLHTHSHSTLSLHTLTLTPHTLLHSLFSFSLWFDLAGAQTRHSAVECWSPQSPHPCFGFGVGLSLFFLPLLAFAFTCLFDSWALNCRKMTVPTPHF